MHLVIHDANLRKVAFVDNTKQTTLNYLSYSWKRDLPTAGSTFEFSVAKKSIQTDNHFEVAYNHLNERAFVSFKHKGKTHLFSVMVVEENEDTISCYCESFNLELINEYANPYKATQAMSFVEYCNAMDLLNFTLLTVGVNEISDRKRTLEWEGQDTKLARLLSLATKFEAEIDFDIELNADSSIKTFYINVYRQNDDSHQGVGRFRSDVRLVYGKNVKSITRKIDKTNIFNAIKPYGKKTVDSKETEIKIGSLGEWSEKNKDGIVEFYQKGDLLYAPLSMQMYPSAFTSSTTNDQWIRKDLVVNSEDPTTIRAEGIKALKRSAYPAITYEVDGFFDAEIGDTVKIFDKGFRPALIIQARVIEQHLTDNPIKNKTVFGNFMALENKVSEDLQSRLNELIEQAKPYTIKLATDNGVIFKNKTGQTLVTPTLYRGGQPITANVTWRWSLNGAVTTGMTYLVKGSSVTNTATLTVSAYIGNDMVAADELSFVNVLDGKDGEPGALDEKQLETINNKIDAGDRTNKEQLDMIAGLVGSDGQIKYNKNRLLGDTERTHYKGQNPIELRHNGDGFVVGKIYTVSFSAECIIVPKENTAVIVTFTTNAVVPVALALTPKNGQGETIYREITSGSVSVELTDSAYTVDVYSNFYKPYRSEYVVDDSKAMDITLTYLDIVDSNQDIGLVGEWSQNPMIIFDGGNR